MPLRLSALLLLLVLTSGCREETKTPITAWLMVRSVGPALDLSPLIAFGDPRKEILVLRGGEWQVAKKLRYGVRLQASHDQRAVLGDDEVFLRDRKTPVPLSREACSTDFSGGAAGETIACLSFTQAAPCDTLTFTEFGVEGAARRRHAFVDPGAPDCTWTQVGSFQRFAATIGFNREGAPILLIAEGPASERETFGLYVARAGSLEREGDVEIPHSPGWKVDPSLLEKLRARLQVIPPRWPGERGAYGQH